jgi:serine/threonine protein kinase
MIIPEISTSDGLMYTGFSFFKKGGMGELYKGFEKDSKKEVILKLIPIDSPDEESLLGRELDASVHLLHDNIVKTLSIGKLNINNFCFLYVIQEYYSSGNLRLIISKNIPLSECYRMMFDILEGMTEVHKYIIHRDLKPENILLDRDKRLYITDFGLAKYINERTRTRSFKGAGTIPYMSPECWTGEQNTISMDIYSLGIIFFEILTGEWPYKAATETEWKECHLFSTFPDISNYRNDVTIKLKQIIQKMTYKKASERYKTVNEIISALNESISLDAESASDAERLAAIGNFAMQKKAAAELQHSKDLEQISTWKKLLGFHVEDIFNKFIEKVNAINERFETSKIIIEKKLSKEIISENFLKLTFNGKSIRIKFSEYNSVEKYEKNMKEQSINFQQQHYGMIMQSPDDSFLKKNNVILVGLAETNFKVSKFELGYNLLLEKDKNLDYGEWFIMSISENVSPPTTSFGLDISIFFEKFEGFRSSSWHTVQCRKFEEKDILNLLEKILL